MTEAQAVTMLDLLRAILYAAGALTVGGVFWLAVVATRALLDV